MLGCSDSRGTGEGGLFIAESTVNPYSTWFWLISQHANGYDVVLRGVPHVAKPPNVPTLTRTTTPEANYESQ
jgi:hypothetical protein